jgi:DtxR family Mn-dependent transcriptional regulator
MSIRKFIRFIVNQKMNKMAMSSQSVSHQEMKVLEFIYRWFRPIRPGDLSKEMNLKHTTLNSQLESLERKNLIKWNRYGPVELTEKGREKARHLNRHHGIIETFLIEILEMSPNKAQIETSTLAPIVSCDFVNSIGERFKLPNICACGNPIPSEEECS